MNALLYLFRKEVKNTLRELIHHPGKALAYVFVIAMLGFSALSNSKSAEIEGAAVPLYILHGGYFVILLFLFALIFLTGQKSGTTFFAMSDVNFLFVSPVSNKLVLAYGLVRQMGSCFVLIFLAICYTPMLQNLFGLSVGQIVLLFLGALAVILAAQILSLLAYGFASGNAGRSNLVKGLLYAVLLLSLGGFVALFFLGGANQAALESALTSPLLNIVPIAGWMRGAMLGAAFGDLTALLIYGLLTVASVTLCLLAFLKGNIDYYEDVLQSTEASFATKQAVKEGRVPANAMGGRRNVKVTTTGLRGGWGASALFCKHLCESRRRSRVPFLQTATLLMVFLNAALAVIFSALKDDTESTGVLMIILLSINCYVLFFLNASGDWSRELVKPYVFLVPEPPFRKLLWATATSMLHPLVGGVLIFVISGLILQASFSAILSSILLYFSLGVLYTAGNVLSMRVFGSFSNKGLIMVLYMLILLLLFVPGAVASALLLFFAGVPAVVAMLPCVLWNLGVGVAIFAVCRNILSNVEYSY